MREQQALLTGGAVGPCPSIGVMSLRELHCGGVGCKPWHTEYRPVKGRSNARRSFQW